MSVPPSVQRRLAVLQSHVSFPSISNDKLSHNTHVNVNTLSSAQEVEKPTTHSIRQIPMLNPELAKKQTTIDSVKAYPVATNEHNNKPLSFDAETIILSGASFTLRPIVVSDFNDITELARYAHHGRDFILQEFSKWIDQSVYRSLNIAVVFNGFVNAPQSNQRSHLSMKSALDPSLVPFLNKVVAVKCVLLLDEGATAWMYALRVHPAFRRLALASKLIEFSIDQSVIRSIKRLRASTDIMNAIWLSSLALSDRHEFQALHSMSGRMVDPSNWNNIEALITHKCNRFNLSTALSRINEFVVPGTIEDVLSIQAKHCRDRHFMVLTQNWISYEFSRDNLELLTHKLKHNILIGRSLVDMDNDSFCLFSSGRDFTGPICSFTVYATNIEQGLLHLYALFQRQSSIARSQELAGIDDSNQYHRMVGIVPNCVAQEFGDEWRADYSFVLLERAL